MILAYDSFQNMNIFRITYLNDKFSASLLNISFGSLWIPDWSKRTTVGGTMTDDGTGSLFSRITASYTTPLWLAEKANLRKISYQSGIHKEPKGNIQKRCRELIIQVCDAEDVHILKGVVSKDHIYYSHMILSLQKAK